MGISNAGGLGLVIAIILVNVVMRWRNEGFTDLLRTTMTRNRTHIRNRNLNLIDWGMIELVAGGWWLVKAK